MDLDSKKKGPIRDLDKTTAGKQEYKNGAAKPLDAVFWLCGVLKVVS